MPFIEKCQISTPSDHEVKVVRSFKAPRALVFKSYTTPELVKRWMLGVSDWEMPTCEMDVRVGGKFRWHWRSKDGKQEFGFHGEYKEVNAPARLVNTEIYEPGTMGGDMGNGSLITTEFTEDNGFTTLTLVMDFFTKAARDSALATGMTDGMEVSYQLLDTVLAQR